MADLAGADDPRPRARLLRGVVGALIAGITLGLFLGERAAILSAVADGFVKLLQMAVLPYVTVSIIGSIGALRMEDLRLLGVRTAAILAALWALALGAAFLMPLAFPASERATFFSTTLLDPAPPFDFVDLYIPANPFFALANSIVPAVVLFSIVIGVALIGVPRKQLLLDVLEAASQTLSRVMRFVVRLTPYGVFAIAATTAGTIRLEQAGRLELYLLSYGALSLLLGLWVLPGLVAALTPIPARAIFHETRDAVITAVVAGDLFIVLPLLIGSCKELSARYARDQRLAGTLPDVIIPVAYNFPHSGKLLSVSFVLFAGWFSDATIHPADYPRLALASVVSLFGSINAAMPFLLDLFRVPADTFQLFVASAIVNSRFGTLVAAMHTVALALLGTCAVTGTLRWRRPAMARYAGTTIVLTALVVTGLRAAGAMVELPYSGGDILAGMHLDKRTAAVVMASADRDPGDGIRDPQREPEPGARLSIIAARKVMRVGYLPDALPYAYFNGKNELVGLDVALMHRLALELNVGLEFVPMEHGAADRPDGVAARLRSGACDVVIGGLVVTPIRAGLIQMSAPYLDETLALIVPDSARRQYESWDSLRRNPRLTIVVPNVRYYIAKLQDALPLATIAPVPSASALFSYSGHADALALPAERGSAWTLRYPQYSVVVPLPDPIKMPLAWGVPRGEPDLAGFINTWLELKRSDGTIDGLYKYWVLGRDAAVTAPRWSVIRDVLHWVR